MRVLFGEMCKMHLRACTLVVNKRVFTINSIKKKKYEKDCRKNYECFVKKKTMNVSSSRDVRTHVRNNYSIWQIPD